MEQESSLAGSLLEKAGAYGKTSIELLKLKTVDTTAGIGSTVLFRLLLLASLLLLIITASIGASLWLAELTGKLYYGFLLIASLYAVIALLLYFLRKPIKAGINDSLIESLSDRICKK